MPAFIHVGSSLILFILLRICSANSNVLLSDSNNAAFVDLTVRSGIALNNLYMKSTVVATIYINMLS